MSKIVVYKRVSTDKQTVERQDYIINEYLQEKGITADLEFSDIISGKTFKRENYIEMKKHLEKDDVLVIAELDRLGRTMDLIKDEWHNLTTNIGVRIVIVNMPLISSDIEGKKTLDMRFIANLVFEILCYSAEKEREKTSERTKAALQLRKERGVILGRPSKIDFNNKNDEVLQAVLSDYNAGLPMEDIYTKHSLSSPTVAKCVSYGVKYGLCVRRKRGVQKRKN